LNKPYEKRGFPGEIRVFFFRYAACSQLKIAEFQKETFPAAKMPAAAILSAQAFVRGARGRQAAVRPGAVFGKRLTVYGKKVYWACSMIRLVFE
jgi:hypothetical protein